MSSKRTSRLVTIGVCLIVMITALLPVIAGAAGPDHSSTTDTAAWNSSDIASDVNEGQVGSQSQHVSATSSGPEIVPTKIKIEYINGTKKVQFQFIFDLPNNTKLFKIDQTSRFDNYSVVTTTGFDNEQLLWDNKTATPSITIEYTLPSKPSDTENRSLRAGIPSISGSIERGDPPEKGYVHPVYNEPRSFTLNTSVRVTGEGLYVNRALILGSYTTYTETVDGQEIVLIVPDGVEMTPSPEDVITAFAATERTIEGDTYEDVHFFIYKGAVLPGGRALGAAGNDQGAVAARNPIGVYIHEYVHTQQSVGLGKDMRWFTEASARYYQEMYQRSNDKLKLQHAKALQRTDPEHGWLQNAKNNETILAEPDTWGWQANYEKGSRLLFALDTKLRAATDSEVTIHDLMRRVNQYDRGGPVTYAKFRQMIVDLAGEETASWLDPYVQTSQNPAQPNASVFAVTPKFGNEPTNAIGGSREIYNFSIVIPFEQHQGSEFVTLGIRTNSRTIDATVVDGNDDGKVDILFQPQNPDGGITLKTSDSADELVITRGSLEESLYSDYNTVEIDLLITDKSATYKISTLTISLQPTSTEQEPNPNPRETATGGQESELDFSNFSIDISPESPTSIIGIGLFLIFASLIIGKINS